MTRVGMLAFQRVAVARVALEGRWMDRQMAEANFGTIIAEAESTEAAYLASKQMERDNYASRCRVATIKVAAVGGGRRTPMIDVDEIRFPDGKVERVDAGEGAAYVAEVAAKRHPTDNRRPEPPKFDKWWNEHSKKIVEWAGQFFEGGTSPRPITVDAIDWEYGLPVEPILEALNSLLDEGWRLVHVSEDRGLYSNPGVVVNDSYPTRVRYLVERP